MPRDESGDTPEYIELSPGCFLDVETGELEPAPLVMTERMTAERALEEGLSVVNPLDEWVDGMNFITRARPHDRMESIPHMRRRGGESQEAFMARLIQHGEDDSYFATRATRAEMQYDGALRHAEWLPTEDSFHPIFCQEG
jgi:hypothetical protein